MATAMMVGKNLAALGTGESSIFKGSGGGGSQLVWEKKSELGQAAQSFFPKAVKLRNDLQWRACSNHNSRPPPPPAASNSLIQQITEPQKTWQPSSGGPKLTKVEQQKPSQSSSSLQTVNDSGPPQVSTKDLVSLQLPRPLSIMDLALPPRHGSDLRVAYQGVPGAYSEAAAAKAYPQCEAVPCEQFDAAFQAVELWLVDRAVLPIENSLGGSIHRNYDLLLRHRLHIVGEVQLAIHHCLLALPGVRKEQLRRVVSHPQALAQCEHTLSKLEGCVREAVDDTAGAAQFISAHNLRDTGAVASARAAEIYGLEILMDGIQDDCDNVTRFLMLAREPIIPRNDRPFKTSIVFTLEEGPGVLFRALAVFSLRNINLTKIESRPQRKRPLRIVDDSNNGTAKYFDYLFYIDFEASMADSRAQNALGHLQEFAIFLRVLGSYPMDMSPMRA